MNLEADKLELARKILETNDPEIIAAIKEFLKNTLEKDFWDDLSPEQQDEIKRASTEIEEGKVVDYQGFLIKKKLWI